MSSEFILGTAFKDLPQCRMFRTVPDGPTVLPTPVFVHAVKCLPDLYIHQSIKYPKVLPSRALVAQYVTVSFLCGC